MVKDIICVACPMGCQISVELNDDGEILSVTGNTCKRGAQYAEKEVTHPTRIVTTSVAVTGSTTGAHTVSCTTASDIPKEKIFAVIDALRGLTVSAPVRIGDVLLPDAAGTGVPIIATKHSAKPMNPILKVPSFNPDSI
mgnify:CR=1 FL=1